MKTSELEGELLDWAVAKCENEYIDEYSTSWEQGGPIIERECIAISCLHITGYTPNTWTARRPQRCSEDGPTPLIAAMRCYVASELGDEVELPEELKQ